MGEEAGVQGRGYTALGCMGEGGKLRKLWYALKCFFHSSGRCRYIVKASGIREQLVIVGRECVIKVC